LSQAIETLVCFSHFARESLDLAVHVADWMIHYIQDKDRHFYYRRYPPIKAKTPIPQ
jgi:hypothetical protein